MKKNVCVALLMFLAILQATEKPYFYYGDIHALGGCPMIGFGVRAQKDIQALDISAHFCPLNPALFHLRGCYLFYPKGKGWYFGGGLGVLHEPETLKSVSGSFEGVLGYQWRIGHNHPIFLEANAMIPFQEPGGRVGRIWPGLTVGLGF